MCQKPLPMPIQNALHLPIIPVVPLLEILSPQYIQILVECHKLTQTGDELTVSLWLMAAEQKELSEQQSQGKMARENAKVKGPYGTALPEMSHDTME